MNKCYMNKYAYDLFKDILVIRGQTPGNKGTDPRLSFRAKRSGVEKSLQPSSKAPELRSLDRGFRAQAREVARDYRAKRSRRDEGGKSEG